MEVQENNMRTQTSKAQLENNYQTIIDRIWDVCDHNDWVIKMDGNRCTAANATIHSIKPKFDDLSWNATKNVAKRFHHFNIKDSRRSMNILFLVLRKLGVINENVKIDISDKEKEINRLRSTYKIMKSKTEEARLAYKEKKGNFYKEKLAQ